MRFKVTIEQAAEIRRRCKAGESQAILAREFGIAQGSVSRIVLLRARTGAPRKTKMTDYPLSEAQIRRMRDAFVDGVGAQDLAGRFSCPIEEVTRICADLAVVMRRRAS